MIFLQFGVAGALLLLLVRNEILTSSSSLIPVPCTLLCAGPEKGDLKMPRTCLKIGHSQNNRKNAVGRGT